MARGWQTQGRSTRDRRRKKQQRTQRPLSEAVKPVKPVGPAVAKEAARPVAASSGWRAAPGRAAAVTTIRAEDYHYVYSDLKRIAVLAAGIFVVLIALSFVIK